MLSRIHSRKIIQHVAVGARNFYKESENSKQDATEVEIPVPWGKIAEIDFGIGIDLVKPPIVDVNKYCKIFSQHAEDILKIEARKTNSPAYSDGEIMQKWIKGTDYSLDEPACRLLMKRGVKEIRRGEFTFSKDPRLVPFNTFYAGFAQDHILKLNERIICPYRLIKATDSPLYQDKQLLETVEKINTSSSDFSYSVLPGKHHIHLTHPEGVAEILNPFLEKYNN